MAAVTDNRRRVRMACIALLGTCTFATTLLWMLLQPQYVADGFFRSQLRLRVTENVTRQPVSTAVVRLRTTWGTGREIPPTEIGKDERPLVVARADENGWLTLECELPMSHTERVLAAKTVVASPEWLWLDVRASSYSPRVLPLRDVIGRAHKPSDFPLSPVEIVLEPIAQADRGREDRLGPD